MTLMLATASSVSAFTIINASPGSSSSLRSFTQGSSSSSSSPLHMTISSSVIASDSPQLSTPAKTNTNKKGKRVLQHRKREWIERSTHYYMTIMRHEKRQALGQLQRGHKYKIASKSSGELLKSRKSEMIMAQNLYFARNQIKYGRLSHAESIYRKLIDDLMTELEEEEANGHVCDHAQLAVSTLLLALLLQRKDQITETRSTFLSFFRIINSANESHLMQKGQVVECACSAKVLQAYALFEMKQGHVKKSYQLAKMAVRMDGELQPILNWKLFKDASELHDIRPSYYDLLEDQMMIKSKKMEVEGQGKVQVQVHSKASP
eukprot:CAMPEP_0194102578 /NCGR_PEP_ID=MMETSP0150-20130528/3180_1 /TAXON_ID=122233 /ORGANISM="Chaetoceros debilis, Strain MM31A-1" /LENGTH=319 /DNA_ID=CAMNT_0038789589 /DNA_START=162 /DNA_END=1121 /DNA_ORIENTATION=-